MSCVLTIAYNITTRRLIFFYIVQHLILKMVQYEFRLHHIDRRHIQKPLNY